MRNKPRIRFKGFTEDWEQRKLGSIGSTYTGLSGKTKEDFGHGEAQYITYLNVFQNTVSDIAMTDKVEIDTTQNEVKYGDVLFTTSSETPEEVGMSSVWLGYTPNIYLNSFCFGFRPNQKIDPYFLGYSLRAPYMRDKIKILAQGISRYNISKNKVMELEINLPNNEEQSLLGKFLRNIDLGITLHQRKLEKLKLTKKALLQKLFPKNGSQFPEIRFKGFTDAWEQRKFCDVMRFINGRAYKQDELLGAGKYKVLRVGNFYTNDSWYYSNLELDDKYYAMNGDLLYTWSATFGPHIWKGEKVIYHYHIWKLVLQNNIDKLFALQLLEVDKANIMSDKNGSTMVHITKQGMEKKQTILPMNLNEQKQIAKFLSSMDKVITLHQRKLDKLQEVKKGLLQKMFV